jgi:hypothetical protein
VFGARAKLTGWHIFGLVFVAMAVGKLQTLAARVGEEFIFAYSGFNHW